MKKVSVSALRANIYNLLDEVVETGEGIEVDRHGVKLRILPATKPKRRRFEDMLGGLPGVQLCSDEELEVDWLVEWRAKWGL